MEALNADVVIVGAGVVGLAVAEAISREQPDAQIIIIEKHRKFGQEISSHNSEVVHAGIYYENAPIKAKFCVQGNRELYEFCEKYKVPYRRCGKFVVASDHNQVAVLESIFAAAQKNGATLERVSSQALLKLNNPSLTAALWSPNTGIVDSHVLMETLEKLCLSRGVFVSYGNEYLSCDHQDDSRISLRIRDLAHATEFAIHAKAFINCAGMASAKVAESMGSSYKRKVSVKPCRGRYFSLTSRWTNQFSQLIYPTHDPRGGLGVHITFDLAGKCRLGPDVDWTHDTEQPDDFSLYRFNDRDESMLDHFFEAGRKLIPNLSKTDLQTDYIGIRPKLFVDGVLNPDFMIDQKPGGLLNLHLLGIESPGLTAAIPLASEVANHVKRALS